MARSMGRQGPEAACLVTVGSGCRMNPCLHTGSWTSSCFLTGWGLSAAEEGREELHMQGGAGDKRAQLLLEEALQALSLRWVSALHPAWALASNRHYRIFKSCGMKTTLGRGGWADECELRRLRPTTLFQGISSSVL